MKIKDLLEVEEDGDIFHGFCPQLPGVHVAGDTEEETLNLLTEATLQHILVLLKTGYPIPDQVILDDEIFD
ncbi:MAG: type II toxin-antitoxin system HicB family antitoxin [Gammaproteobacteria bacterium]|nr:type II toxin-antitoxin system HicB family antitoxin [Gammaproteobacteria bacterium]